MAKSTAPKIEVRNGRPMRFTLDIEAKREPIHAFLTFHRHAILHPLLKALGPNVDAFKAELDAVWKNEIRGRSHRAYKAWDDEASEALVEIDEMLTPLGEEDELPAEFGDLLTRYATALIWLYLHEDYRCPGVLYAVDPANVYEIQVRTWDELKSSTRKLLTRYGIYGHREFERLSEALRFVPQIKACHFFSHRVLVGEESEPDESISLASDTGPDNETVEVSTETDPPSPESKPASDDDASPDAPNVDTEAVNGEDAEATDLSKGKGTPYEVECAFCQAKPGQHCRREDGSSVPTPHHSRTWLSRERSVEKLIPVSEDEADPENVAWLTSIPATDPNFTGALERATRFDLAAALDQMTDEHDEPTKGNKTRVKKLRSRFASLLSENPTSTSNG